MYGRRPNRGTLKPYTSSAYDREQMAEARRHEEEALEAGRQELESEVVHPAFAGVAAYLASHDGIVASNDDCQDFALEQIAKIGKKAPESLKPEIRRIYADVRERGGDAYQQHKTRLQELSK
jgi:hypothetical protein